MSYEEAFAEAVAAGAVALDFSDGGAEPWREEAMQLLTQENVTAHNLYLAGYSSESYGASLNIAEYWLTDESTVAWLMDNVANAEPPPVITPVAPTGDEEQIGDDGKSRTGFGVLDLFGFKIPWWLLALALLVLFVPLRKILK